MCLFLAAPWVGLQCVMVAFPDHTHLLFKIVELRHKMYVYTFFPLQFIVSIVDQACRISRYGSRVGLIEFSESKKTHVEFKFGQLNSKRLVHRGIDRVGYDRGKMSVSCMLSVACETRDI